jgi:hypothetical protein
LLAPWLWIGHNPEGKQYRRRIRIQLKAPDLIWVLTC